MEAVKAQLQQLQQQRAAIEAEINERAARLNAPGQPGMQGSLLDKEGFPRADIDVHGVRVDRNAVIRLSNDHKALSQQMEALLHQLHALAREAGTTSQPSAPSTPPPPSVATPAAAAAAAGPADSGGSDGGAQDASAAAKEHSVAANEHEDKKPRLNDSSAGAGGGASIAGQAAAAAAAAPLRPFAVVDEVSEASPAAAAGIQLGDQLCRFGSASAADSGSSSSSSSVLQAVAAELQQHEGRPVAAVFIRAGQPVTLSLTPQRWAGRGLLGCHLRPL